MKRSPLRRVSLKQAARLRQYARLRKKFLDLYWLCKWCNAAEATDVHHVAGRGRNLLEGDTWLALCRNCHSRVHDNPKLARAMGFLK